jgi:hypothetical protein
MRLFMTGLLALGCAFVTLNALPGAPRAAWSALAETQQAGRAELASRTCRVKKTLSYDYGGNPYVRKVRICA